MKNKNKKFQVISVNPFRDCNLDCSFCYRKAEKESSVKPLAFFIELVPYLSKLTGQVALGGGEPLMKPNFVKEFSSECTKHGLICNITSNGKLLYEKTDKEILDLLKNVTMISISLDREKVPDDREFLRYMQLVERLSKLGIRVGCNLLVDDEMFLSKAFLLLINELFKKGAERVFALYPKNILGPDILKYSHYYIAATALYKHFYIDDCTRQILLNSSYTHWKNPCHFGDGILCIEEDGSARGCSFESNPVIILEKPKDIMFFQNYEFQKRYKCPFLITGGI